MKTLVLKLAGNNCNMKCDYCYEQNSINSNIDVVSDIAPFLNKYRNERICVIFRGGEPLLLGIDCIKYVLDCLDGMSVSTIQFQTNGTMINDDWIDIFKAYKVSVSVSLDPMGKQDMRICDDFYYRDVVIKNLIKLVNSSVKNIGVVSVAHLYNHNNFISFIKELIDLGISSFTINKYRGRKLYALTEREYLSIIKETTLWYIKERVYRKIKIMPINALFSSMPNKLCAYSSDKNKCNKFITFTPQGIIYHCEHYSNEMRYYKCNTCDILSQCGGGFFCVPKDDGFCDARRDFLEFVRRIKHGN